MNFWAMWLVITILLGIIFAYAKNETALWFMISSALTLILSLFVNNVWIQCIVFLLIGTLLHFIMRKGYQKRKEEEEKKKHLQTLIESIGNITEEVSNEKSGMVKINEEICPCIALEKIAIGSKVKVLNVEGMYLVVSKIKEEKPKKKKKTGKKQK